jgi:DNA polymerase/3'-5' exonuclease PolX
MKAITEPTEPKRFPRAMAIEVAEELHGLLAEWCVKTPTGPRIAIVGSVRRGKPLVKDLELLYISESVLEPDPTSLFGEERKVSVISFALDLLVSNGTLAKRLKCDGTATWGESIRLAVHVRTGLPVDFFAATMENWWNQLVCRTGGKDSNTAICNAAIERNLKWSTTSAGFVNPRTGQLSRTVRCERDAFEIVGLPYLEPHQRP